MAQYHPQLLLTPYAVGKFKGAYRKFSYKDWLRIVSAGVLLGCHFYMFFEAIQRTTVASATVFVAVTPIFLVVLGYLFLNEKISLNVGLAIAVSVLGGLLIAYGDVGNESAIDPVLGNLLALGACLFASIYLLIGRVVRQQMDWIAYVYPLYLVCAATVLMLAVFTGAPLLGLEPSIYLICAAMAIFPHLLGHDSFNYAIKYFSATFLGILSLTEPIGATAMAYALFDEFPNTISLAGMALTLIGVYMALYPGRRKAAPQTRVDAN